MFTWTSKDTEDSGWKRKNLRRLFCTKYPSGAVPLAALLSMAESEDTDGTDAGWLEDRFVLKQITTKINGLGGGAFASTVPATSNPQVVAAGTDFRVYVTDGGTYDRFLVGEQIAILNVDQTGGTIASVSARITALDAGKNFFVVRCDSALSLVNAVGNVGHSILPIGAVVAEGSGVGYVQENIRWPIQVTNLVQTVRNWMSFTDPGVRQALDFERMGPYQTKLRQTYQSHMNDLESALLFGNRSTTVETLPDGTVAPLNKMGGIEWFLQEYQKVNGGMFNYRPGGTVVPSTLNTFTHPDQRIFRCHTSGVLAKADWEDLILPKIMSTVANSSGYKLFMGGQQALLALSRYYDGKFVLNREAKAEYKIGFNIQEVTTPLGTSGFVTHPKFNEVPALRGSFIALEIGNLRLRPVKGEDTAVHTNLQAPAELLRRDDIRTACTLELQYPETFAYVTGLNSIA